MKILNKTVKFIKFKALLLCAAIIFCCVNIFGQGITWQRTYDGVDHLSDGSFSACYADGDNIYVAGMTTLLPNRRFIYVMKLNRFGDTLWTRTLTPNINSNSSMARAITSSGDGGCVLTGSSSGSFTIKLDLNGNIIWNQNYGGGLKQCYSIIKTSDGGYIACGRDTECSTDCAYILKIDSLGNLQWQQTYPAGYWKNFQSITETNDLSGYIAVGFNMNFSSDIAKAYIAKINYNGDLIWDKQFLIQGNTAIRNIYKFKEHYIISGGTVSYIDNFTKLFFGILDEFGDTIKIKIFESNLNEYYGDFDIITENKFVIASSRDSIQTLNGHVFTFDSTGTIINDKIYLSADVLNLYFTLPLAEGDILFGGSVDFDPVHTRNDIYVLRTDSLLNAPPPNGIINQNINTPLYFKLYQNIPNPFNPITKIFYEIYKSTIIKLSIYNISGQLINILENSYKSPGMYSYDLNTVKLNLASGVYFVMLESIENFKQSIKIVLTK